MDVHSSLGLIGFLVATFVVASSGAVFNPGDWYREIRKPRWTPPRWAFPLVWTPLYVMIAVSGWLIWRQAGLAPVPFGFYAAQLVFNGAWSAFFFGLRRPDIALVDLVALWLAVFGTILAFAPIDATAAWLLVPYLAWGSFAGMLNIAILRLNGPRFARS